MPWYIVSNVLKEIAAMSAKLAWKILLAIVLVIGIAGQTAILAESADDPAPIQLPPRAALPRGLDWRLYSIARNPNYLDQTDQRKCRFDNDEDYLEVLNGVMRNAARVMPDFFSSTNESKFKTKALSHFPVNNHYPNAKELQRQHALEIMTTDNLLQIKVALHSEWEMNQGYRNRAFGGNGAIAHRVCFPTMLGQPNLTPELKKEPR
jgi:hypothetical protein